MKKSHFLIAGAAIIAAGGIATYLYFRNVALKVSSPLGIAQVVPESAIMATFFQPNQQALTKLQQFGTPEARKLIAQEFEKFKQENLAETNIDLEKDLKPWVGGVMLALCRCFSEGQDTEPVNILMVVGIKNKFEALKFANKLKGDEKSKVKERDYQGVTIREVTDNSGKIFNLAILGDYLAIAPVATAVEEAIDTFQGKAISMREDATESWQQNVGVENAIASIFIPNYSELMTAFADDLSEKEKLPASSLGQLQQIDSVVMAIGVDDAGLRLRAVTKLNSPLTEEQIQPVSGEVLKRFPAETMMLISGKGIGQAWSQFVAKSEGNKDLRKELDMVRKTFKDLNLDVEREVFGWMDGEFAVGLIGSNQGMLAQIGVGGGMILETSDRSMAEATLKKLNTMAVEKGGLAVKEKKVGALSVTEWQMAGLGAFLGYGWLDDDSLFVALGEPLISVMMAMSGDGLVGSGGFEEVVGSLPMPNQGYFYLDMDKTMVWANGFPLAKMMMSPDSMAILSSIRGVGVTASWSDELTNEMEMLLALRK
jgi:hypothetical protein